MSEDDLIRECVYYSYIFPAVLSGQSQVSISVWDFYKQTGIKKRDFSGLISALCRSFMKQKYGIKAIRRDPPTDGPDVVITYEL